ncbi:hypothetical protein DV736_g2822, partial [Chaetothyriales sp. CBS 134916]
MPSGGQIRHNDEAVSCVSPGGPHLARTWPADSLSPSCARDAFELREKVLTAPTVSRSSSVSLGPCAAPGRASRHTTHTTHTHVMEKPMDSATKDVFEKGKSLTKAIAAHESTATVVAILQDLRSTVKPTEKLLRDSQIGRTVNKIKGIQGLDPQVQQLASEIISRWRHLINEQKAASAHSSTPGNARSNATASPAPRATTTTPVLAAQPKAASPGVAPEKRTWKTDKVPRDGLTSDTARNNCIGLLYDGLAFMSTLPMREILQFAKDIEAACLALPGTDNSAASAVYKEKIRSLYQNLKNKSNPRLREKILEGKITASRFATMSPEEMKSKEQRDEDKKMEKENANNAMVAKEEKSVSESLECGKCHQRKVSYTQAQTRSADEPMTTFCECLNCGHRWKFS